MCYQYALDALNKIFWKGYQYKKAGCIILEIVSDEALQLNMFDNVDREKHSKLMKVKDKLNKRFTRNLITLAVQGNEKKWKRKQELLSPCYTTRLSDIIKIK